MKKAFSLVELIVVIGIIGILAGTLSVSFSGSAEKARAVKCLSNMRNLAMAWRSGCRAGSQEHLNMVVTLGGSATGNYYEENGWVSSDTKGIYPSASHQTFQPIGFGETDRDKREFAIQNGWMYAAMGNDSGTYVCPSHLKMRQGEIAPLWSYFMNAHFGWDAAEGKHTYIGSTGAGAKGTNADRLLMFAEIPFDKRGPGSWFPDGDSATKENDGVLQYKGCNTCDAAKATGGKAVDGNENIGGNHKYGKYWHAHVAFADGHVEKLRVGGVNEGNLVELTTWLCQGHAVGLDNGHWDRLDE